jgi:hypothetical protein
MIRQQAIAAPQEAVTPGGSRRGAEQDTITSVYGRRVARGLHRHIRCVAEGCRVLKKAACCGKASGRLRAFPESTHVPESGILDPSKPRRLNEPIGVSLESLVPRDH